MWEISVGDTQFLYIMQLMSPKDLGCIVHPGIIH